MYTGIKETRTRVEANAPRCQYDHYKYIFIGPVGWAHYEPEVILTYNDSTQMMRLVHATLWEKGSTLAFSFIGRYDYTGYTSGVVNSGKCQAISHCNGEWPFPFRLIKSKRSSQGHKEPRKEGAVILFLS